MCDTTAYVVEAGSEKLLMESVQVIRPEDGGVYMRNLFGEETTFKGRIKEILLNKGKVILEP